MPDETPKGFIQRGVKDVLQFVGVSDLSVEEQDMINDVCGSEMEKLSRKVSEPLSGSLHVKTYASDGSRKKYSIHLKLGTSKFLLDSSKQDDWDLPKAIHKAFESCYAQLKHKQHFRT